MRFLCILLCAFLHFSAWGELTFKNKTSGAEVRLKDSACVVPEILEQLRDEYRDQFKAAVAVVNGKTFAGCWIEDEGTALMIFDNGERLGLRMSVFSDPMV